ncbi:MAG: preprotein translocase subunit SecE [Candidatus Eisenbacteria bacterium]|nr:preprotein translocase subunit SecE [Candidatus Eisenbacteria bacterium]
MAQIVQQSVTFLKEVRDEFRKVSRPTLPELRNSTLVVSITVGLIGLTVGLLDQIFGRVVQLVLSFR